jgi:hypothetical protein
MGDASNVKQNETSKLLKLALNRIQRQPLEKTITNRQVPQDANKSLNI